MKNLPMTTKQLKLTDQVRRAIEQSSVTRYRIAQETGIAESTLSRFMSGERGFSLASLDALADFLDLQIVVRGTKRKAD